MLLVSFWSSSVINCVCKYLHTKLLKPRLLATKVFTRFSLLTLETQTYTGSSPATTDDASCFDASWLGINTTPADFLMYTFIEAAVLPASTPYAINEYEEWREGGHMHETN